MKGIPLEEEIITQMGLMLTQLRIARRALEDIESSTARYGSFAFASALSEGPSFGTPPLLNGALKVYLVNIRELAPGSGFGGFLEGLLGGVGRFFGGLFGGIAGGFVSAVSLPGLIVRVENIARIIERILDRLGIRAGSRAAESGSEAAASRPSASTGAGTNLAAQLAEIRRTVDVFTSLFQAASGDTEGAARRSDFPSTPGGERWLAMLRSVRDVVAGISRIIDGLILFVPILLGSLVLLIQRFDVVKLAVIEVLQFILRNVFLLRGVVLTTIADTVSAAAGLAGNILGILGATVERVLSSIFRMIGHILEGAVAALRFVANGLQNTIDRLLRWLVGTLGAVLTQIGDLRIFRVLVHVIRIIPAVLPPLYELIRGSSPPLTPTQLGALSRAARLTIPGPSRAGAPGREIPGFPDLAEALVPPSRVSALASALSTASTGLTREMRGIFGTARGTLFSLGRELDRAARRETEFSRTRLESSLQTVVRRSDELASALSSAQEAARERPTTGLEEIASAYESWLSGGGLNTLLGNLTRHFQRTPPAETGTIPRRIVEGTTVRPRATVDIQNVTIEIAPPETTGEETEGTSEPETERTGETEIAVVGTILRHLRELQERGGRAEINSLYDVGIA